MPFRFFAIILLVVLVASCFYLYEEKTVAGDWGLALDDSWIHMVFARNLAGGHGFSFNPGEPVSGATSPLWVFLMSVIFILGTSPIWGAKFIGVILFMGSCFFVYRITLDLTSDKRSSFFASLLVVLSPYLTWGALSGMETALYTFLSTFGIWVHLKCFRAHGIKRYLPTLIFTLSGLARPECFLLVVFSWIDILIYDLRFRKGGIFTIRSISGYLLHPAIFLVMTAPYFLFNYETTHSFFPNTYAAKVGSAGLFGALSSGNLSAVITTLTVKPLYMLLISIMVLFKSNPLLSAFFVLGLFVMVKRYTDPTAEVSSLILPIATIIYPLGMGVFAHVLSLGQSHRYIHNLFPLFYIISTIGLFSVWRFQTGELVTSERMKRGATYILGAGALLIVCLLFGKPLFVWIVGLIGPHTALTHLSPGDLEFYWGNLVNGGLGISLMLVVAGFAVVAAHFKNMLLRWKSAISAVVLAALLIFMVASDFSYAHFYALNVKNINDMHITLGSWVDDNTPEEAVIALGDVGGITYTSQRRIIDIAGLMTPGIIPYQHQRGQEGILEYFQKVECPDYLIIYQDMYSRLLSLKEHFQKVFEVKIENNTICGYDRMAVFKVKCD